MTWDSVLFSHLLGSSRLHRLKSFVPRRILIVLPYICASGWPADFGSSVHSWRCLVWYEGRYKEVHRRMAVAPPCLFCRNLHTSAVQKLPRPRLSEAVHFLFILRLYCTGLLLIDFRRKTQVYLFRFFWPLCSITYSRSWSRSPLGWGGYYNLLSE